MLVDKLEHLLHQRLRALILDVSLGRAQKRANSVDGDAALNEAGAGPPQFFKPVVVARIHDAQQRARLQTHLSGVDVLDELSEHVRLKLFNN